MNMNGFCWNLDLFLSFIGFLDHLHLQVVQKPLFPICFNPCAQVRCEITASSGGLKAQPDLQKRRGKLPDSAYTV